MTEKTSSGSYDALRAFQDDLSDNRLTNPSLTSVDRLRVLKELNKVNDWKDDIFKKSAMEEKKLLELSLKAIRNNPILASKYPNDIEGAAALSGILKMRQSSRVADSILDKILDSDETLKPEAVRTARNGKEVSAKIELEE